jgi:hypothetical protein
MLVIDKNVHLEQSDPWSAAELQFQRDKAMLKQT